MIEDRRLDHSVMLSGLKRLGARGDTEPERGYVEPKKVSPQEIAAMRAVEGFVVYTPHARVTEPTGQVLAHELVRSGPSIADLTDVPDRGSAVAGTARRRMRTHRYPSGG